MKKILMLLAFASFVFANENFVNMKNCESFKLSNFTTLLSCHQIDYLIEYKNNDDEEKDSIKKITAITVKDQRIVKSTGR